MANLPKLAPGDKLVGRAIVIDHFGARLLGRRPPAPIASNNPDKWELYGGSFDPDKDDIALYGLDTAIRELREERGCVAHPHPHFPEPRVLEHRPFHETGDNRRILTMGWRLLVIAEVEPTTPYERVDDGWFMPEQMRNMDITDATRAELEQAGLLPAQNISQLLASAR